MIRAALAAVPGRGVVLGAKAAVFGVVALGAGEAGAFISFAAGGAALRHGIAGPALTRPEVFRAVVLAGARFSLIGLFGLGLGAIPRPTPAAIAGLGGGGCLAAQFIRVVGPGGARFPPGAVVRDALTTTKRETCPPHAALCPHFLSAWAGLGVLCLYAAAVLGIGAWLLARRDA